MVAVADKAVSVDPEMRLWVATLNRSILDLEVPEERGAYSLVSVGKDGCGPGISAGRCIIPKMTSIQQTNLN